VTTMFYGVSLLGVVNGKQTVVFYIFFYRYPQVYIVFY